MKPADKFRDALSQGVDPTMMVNPDMVVKQCVTIAEEMAAEKLKEYKELNEGVTDMDIIHGLLILILCCILGMA